MFALEHWHLIQVALQPGCLCWLHWQCCSGGCALASLHHRRHAAGMLPDNCLYVNAGVRCGPRAKLLQASQGCSLPPC